MKRKKAWLLILAIAAVVLAVIWGGGFSTRSAVRIAYTGSETRSNWTGRYASLDGAMRKTIHPKGDQLHIEVETKSGTISMEFRDADGELLFDGDDMETGTFDVPVSGKVTVLIEADHHQGSFRIDGGSQG